MGPRLLCFAGGAALTAFYVHLGLLATPFFGSGAFLWATVFACFLLALALGYGIGDALSRIAGPLNLERAGPRLAVAGGALAWFAAWLLPIVCRSILADDPEWELAPPVAITLVSLIPGALIAAIVPSELRVRLADPDVDPKTTAQNAVRLLGLMTIGGVVGIILTAKPLLRADEVDVFVHAYGTGLLLLLIGASQLGLFDRIGAGVALGGLIALTASHPSEIQEEPYKERLVEAWRQGRETQKDFQRMSSGDDREKPGIILTLELLLTLGDVKLSGDGLRRTLNKLISEESKPFIMPVFEQIQAVRSDGKGMIFFTIKKSRDKRGAYFSLPGKNPGERVEFWFRDDFTIHITKNRNVWRLDLGPVTTERAGLLDFNDTRKTPIRVLNVALWIDASILSLIFEDKHNQLDMKVVAQGEIGGVKTKDVFSVPKKKKKKKD